MIIDVLNYVCNHNIEYGVFGGVVVVVVVVVVVLTTSLLF